MAIRRVMLPVYILVDDEKQYLGGKDWKGLVQTLSDVAKNIAGPEKEVIVEDAEPEEMHVHVSSEYENCDGCISLAQNEKK